MKTSPKVSVLMSVYNDSCYLAEAIDSILDQTFTDFEFIIVDDGSTDDTPAILDSYDDPRIIRLDNKVNLGLTKSLNRGLHLLNGIYVARQDANDISLPDRLAKQVSFMDSHPQVAVVGTAYIEYWQDSQAENLILMPLEHEQISQKVFYGHAICHAGAMIRRTCLQTVNGYNEDFQIAQDRDLWLRLLEHYELANLSDPLYKVQMLSKSITGAKRPQQRRAARQAVLNALERGRLRPKPVTLGRFYWGVAIDELAVGNEEGAARYMKQAIIANTALDNDADDLAQMVVYRAFEVGPAALSHNKSEMDAACGLKFLDDLFAILPAEIRCLQQHRRWAIAELHAAYAFAAFQQENYRMTFKHGMQAFLRHQSQRQNRGLLSILARSIWRYFQKRKD